MANQEIVDYIKKYKDSYPEESIRIQLVNSGYSESEINEAFGGNSQVTNLENAHYAGFWIRFLAYILDSIIIAIPLTLVYIILNFILVFIFSISEIAAFLITYVIFAVLPIIVFLTYEFIMVGKKGATLGKMIVGAKITKDNGEEMDMGSSALRLLGKFINSFTLCIGFLMVGFTEKKQGLHDMIAKTYVIYKR